MNSADTPKNARERLIIALDLPDAESALRMARELAEDVTFFKIGLQLYTAAGPEIVRAVQAMGAKVFLDLKLHDIPNTVAKAVSAAAELEVAMLTIHLGGGGRMIEAAATAAPADLLILGVTVLTSSDEATLRETGINSPVEEQTVRLHDSALRRVFAVSLPARRSCVRYAPNSATRLRSSRQACVRTGRQRTTRSDLPHHAKRSMPEPITS
jgi:orotidine-5'-phosphate decarboxylase